MNDEMSDTHERRACPECGAAWIDESTCESYFHQMLYWENERPELGEVHHLMVLCYHLQHLSLYSVEGLQQARQLLIDFVEGGLTPEEARRRNREHVASGKRRWSITARPGNRGTYERPVAWTMTAADVVAGGPERYNESIRDWAYTVSNSINSA